MLRIVPTRILVVMLWLIQSIAAEAQNEIQIVEDLLQSPPVKTATVEHSPEQVEPAEAEELEPPEPIDAYHIELILFSRRISDSLTIDPEPLYYRRPDTRGFTPGIYNAPDGPLYEEVGRLVRSPDYEVWSYASWRQVAARTGSSPRVQMASLAAAFTGWLKVYDNNILLSEMDIEFIPDRDRALVEAPEEPVLNDLPDTDILLAPEAGYDVIDLPVEYESVATPEPESRYRINERRRVRFNEQHYFDHPRFGVLLRVERAEITINETLGILEEEVGETLQDGELPDKTSPEMNPAAI